MTRIKEKNYLNNINKKEIGKRLRLSRKKSALEINEVAQKIKQSGRTIQNHESGQNSPKPRTIRLYAEIYGVSVEWLQTGKEPYGQPEEHMLPRKEHEAPDSGPGHMKTPSDLTDYRVVTLIRPEEGQRRNLHAKLDEILESGNIGLIAAITCNLEEFARSAQKDRILESVGRKPGIQRYKNDDDQMEQPSPSSKIR